MKRRVISLATVFVLILLIMTGRLISIQFIRGAEYAEMASKQYTAALNGLTVRGSIYDRHGHKLTGRDDNYIFLIEKRKMDDGITSLLESVDAMEVNNLNERYNIYRTYEIDKEICGRLCKEYGALALKSNERYSQNQPAVHVIGFINQSDSRGVCGLEKDYDDILSSVKRSYLGQTDGQGFLIPGLGIRMEGDDLEWGVITTLDIEIQQMAEKILDESGVNGTIIVTEASTGEILATASRPIFSPYRIEDYLESNDKEFLNKATQCQYPPGSIFKIIVAAAAIEKRIINEDSLFECKGYHEIDGLRVKCSTGGEEGHGLITLREAFAYSCNSVFIQVGQMVGADDILNMARSFGITKEAVDGLSGQLTGNLPSSEDAWGAGIGNLSIGQGKLLVTPMQVSRITQIVACDGMDTGLSIVSGTIEGEKGFVSRKNVISERVISSETASVIRDMMMDTVIYGTADNLVLDEGTTAAGKTGSADAVVGENQLVHSWFTGFAPAEAPEYVITVFVENGGSGRKSAVPLFQKMLDFIEPSHN